MIAECFLLLGELSNWVQKHFHDLLRWQKKKSKRGKKSLVAEVTERYLWLNSVLQRSGNACLPCLPTWVKSCFVKCRNEEPSKWAFKADHRGLSVLFVCSVWCVSVHSFFSVWGWSVCQLAPRTVQKSQSWPGRREVLPMTRWLRTIPTPYWLRDFGQVASSLSLGFLNCKLGMFSWILEGC